MAIFEKPPLETLTPAKDRWTPIYLEHGRLEVDDSSIKWIGARMWMKFIVCPSPRFRQCYLGQVRRLLTRP